MCCDVLLLGGCEDGGAVVGSGSGSEATGRDGRDVFAHLTAGRSSSNVDSCADGKTHGNVGLPSGAGGNGNGCGSGGSDEFESPCEADNCGVASSGLYCQHTQ